VQMSHKTQAAIQFLAPTAMIYFAVAVFLIDDRWPSWAVVKENSLAFVGIGLAAMLVQDLIPKAAKEVLVFWRLHERLPGHRAFSEIAFQGSNIDRNEIPDFESLRDSESEKQQIEFYKMYRNVGNDSAVSHISQRYIAWRDTTVLLFLLSLITVPVVYTIDQSKIVHVGLTLSAVSLACAILTAIAAQNSAVALVIQVLSLRTKQESING
jgi:hypothetical protein